MNERSAFELFSIGIVIEDKPRDSDIIKVDPVELLPFHEGELNQQQTRYEVQTTNKDGVALKAISRGTGYLEATWIPYGESNRDSSPDVCKGETVHIYRYSDTDQYFWTTMMREPLLRGKEIVRYMFSNQNGGSKAYDKDTSYWVEYDTVNKHIHLHVSSNDGEMTEIDVKIDTRSGITTIEDRLDNRIELNHGEGTLHAVLREEIHLETKRVFIRADEKVQIETPQLTADTSAMFRLTAPGAVLGGGSAGAVGGRSKFTGGLHTDGDIEVEGQLHTTGDIQSDGRIIDTGGNTNHHSH